MLRRINDQGTAIPFRNKFRGLRESRFDQKLVLEKCRLPGAVIPDPNIQVDREDAPFGVTRGSAKLAHGFANGDIALFHVALDCANQWNRGVVTLGSPKPGDRGVHEVGLADVVELQRRKVYQGSNRPAASWFTGTWLHDQIAIIYSWFAQIGEDVRVTQQVNLFPPRQFALARAKIADGSALAR